MLVNQQRLSAGSLILLCLLLAASAFGNELYRWQDAEGNWKFSDTPPAQGQSESMAVPVAPLTEPSRQDSRDAIERIRKAQSIIDRSEQRDQQEQATAQQQAEKNKAAWKQQHCRTEQRPVRRGLAGGGSRLVGHKNVLVCDRSMPEAYREEFCPEPGKCEMP